MGKASSENVHIAATIKLVNGLKIPTINGQADSVSGLCHALVRVGTAAVASLMIAKMIARFGSLVRYHKTRAKIDKTPQR